MLWIADVPRLYVEFEAASVERSRKLDELRDEGRREKYLCPRNGGIKAVKVSKA